MSKDKSGVICDILIENAQIITMDGDNIVSGCLGVVGDTIVYTGKKHPGIKGKKTINASGCIVMPGLINAHTHSPMSIFRGYADDMELFDWLNSHIWPVEKEFVTEENVALASELSIAEMIRSGTTSFNDMYFYSDITAAVAEKAGIRAILGEAVIDVPFPVFKISEDFWKEKAERPVERGLVRSALVAHSPYSCSKKILERIREVSEKTGRFIHIHISETDTEVERILTDHGMTPVQYLDSIGLFDCKVAAVHCVALSDKDIDILAKRKTGVIHCPQSNLKLGSGIARIPEMIKAGITIALGTDGQASNNTLDMFAEMKTAALLHKGICKDPSLLQAREVIRMATSNAASILGLKGTGVIAEGNKADIIIVDMKSVHNSPLYDPCSHIVYCAKGTDVKTVIINGKTVMENGQLLTINEETVKKRVNELSSDIRKFRNSNGRIK